MLKRLTLALMASGLPVAIATALQVMATLSCFEASRPGMRAAGGGSIVNVESAAASIEGVPNRFVYPTTKAAASASAATRSARAPSRRRRIAAQATVAGLPMGRLDTPDDIAALAVYLGSDESAFTTGAVHVIDGGWSM